MASIGSPTLSGQLGSISIQDILGFLATLRVAGLLEVESAEGSMSIYLHDGLVVWGRAERGGLPPGQLLVDRGRLSSEELAEIRHKAARPPEIYLALVGLGHLEEGDLESYAGEELCENIYRLFSWTPGTFRFVEAATVPPGVQAVRIEVQGLLLEAARRMDEWSRLPAIYSDPTTCFELMAEPKNGEKVSLDLDEWKLLYLVSSHRNLKEIWHHSPLGSRLETSRTLFGLATARLIRASGETTSAALRLADERGQTADEAADLAADDGSLLTEAPLTFTGAMAVPEGLRPEASERPEVGGPGTVSLPAPSAIELSSTLPTGPPAPPPPPPAAPGVPSPPSSGAAAPEPLPTVRLPPLPADLPEPPAAEPETSSSTPPQASPFSPPGDPLATQMTRLPTQSRRLTRAQIRVERSGRLAVVLPEDDGRVFPVGEKELTLGRAKINDIVLADGHVSGRHGRLIRDGDHFVLEDLGSSNGLRVDGKRTPRALLRGGEEIEIFPFKLRFELDFEIFESSGEVVSLPS